MKGVSVIVIWFLMLTMWFLTVRLNLFFYDRPISWKRCCVLFIMTVLPLLAFRNGINGILALGFIFIGSQLSWLLEKRLFYLGRLLPIPIVICIWTWVFLLETAPRSLPELIDLKMRTLSILGLSSTQVKSVLFPALVVSIAALISTSEINLLIRWIIERLNLKPRVQREAHVLNLEDSYARGRIIGSLERIIILALSIKGEYAAIGLIVAMKGMARIEEMKNRDFAEYFLIGTMLSICSAGFLGMLTAFIIN